MTAGRTARRVVITGMGAVTPVGHTASATWDGLVAGRSGVGPIDLFPAEQYPVRIAGLVKDFDPGTLIDRPELLEHLSRAGTFGLAAATEAIGQAGLDAADIPAERRGVCLGATAGRPELAELAEIFHRIAAERPLYRQPVGSVLTRDQNTSTVAIARRAGAAGSVSGTSTACTASGHALGEAYRLIRDGEATVMLAGGCDSLITWLDVLGFSLLGALTTDHADRPELASRPFADDRSGFVLGEGAVIFVLEDRESAMARGAEILAEVAGYAATMNAYRMTDPPPDGGGVSLAMAQALAASGLDPARIGYVAAHGTSTPGNDLCETNAIKDVFGPAAGGLAVSSVKSMVGHLTAAAAGLGLLGALGVLREGLAPPTINLDPPDPRLDLNYVPNEAQKVRTDAVMVNAFAFGGTNACLVLTRHDPAEEG